MASNNSISNQHSEKMQSSILNKLQEMNVQQADADMLTEFILVLMVSQKAPQDMAKELAVFLEDGINAAEFFVSWLISFQNSSSNIMSVEPNDKKVSNKDDSEPHSTRSHREPYSDSPSFRSRRSSNSRRSDKYSSDSISRRREEYSDSFPRRKETHRSNFKGDDESVSFTISLNNNENNENSNSDVYHRRRPNYQSRSRNRSISIDRNESIRNIQRESLPKSRKFSATSPNVPKEEEEINETKIFKKSIPCLYFPSCNLGDLCPYSHDGSLKKEPVTNMKSAMPCKYNHLCKNASCPYVHSSPALVSSNSTPNISTSEICRYFPWCGRGEMCAYVHPPLPIPTSIPTPQTRAAVPCRYGPSCARVDCIFLHPTTDAPSTPCRFGSACTRPFCMLRHDFTSPFSSTGTHSVDAMDSSIEKPQFSETITSPPGSPFLLALSDG